MIELKAEQWLDYAGEPMPCYPKAVADKYICKYKRKHCLDMANKCLDKLEVYEAYHPLVVSNKFTKFYIKWHRRWIALAKIYYNEEMR